MMTCAMWGKNGHVENRSPADKELPDRHKNRHVSVTPPPEGKPLYFCIFVFYLKKRPKQAIHVGKKNIQC